MAYDYNCDTIVATDFEVVECMHMETQDNQAIIKEAVYFTVNWLLVVGIGVFVSLKIFKILWAWMFYNR